jgi:hypothetical protein
MAQEIIANASLLVSKGGASIQSSGQKIADMAGGEMITNVQIVGTTAEQLVVGDITTPGYCFLKNLDNTNYVDVGLDSGVSTQVFARLMPGDIALFPAKTQVMYAKANAAPVNLLVSFAES